MHRHVLQQLDLELAAAQEDVLDADVRRQGTHLTLNQAAHQLHLRFVAELVGELGVLDQVVVVVLGPDGEHHRHPELQLLIRHGRDREVDGVGAEVYELVGLEGPDERLLLYYHVVDEQTRLRNPLIRSRDLVSHLEGEKQSSHTDHARQHQRFGSVELELLGDRRVGLGLAGEGRERGGRGL